MARPMSDTSQEILEIVRAHGPLTRDQILERSTLIGDRADLALRLNSLTRDDHLLRTADKRYAINGRNGTPRDATGAELDRLLDTAAPPAAAPTTLQAPPRAPEREPETARSLSAVARKHVRPPRPQDELLPAAQTDRTEQLLQQAAALAQQQLDQFIRDAGPIAEALATLMRCRDETLQSLHNYRRRSAA